MEVSAARKNHTERSTSLGGTGEIFDWPSFEFRMNEMNSARSGDIIVITDGREGYLALDNDSESYRGWHGGPTISESEVPLIFSMPGTAFVDDNGGTLDSAPDNFVNGINQSLNALIDSDGNNRNWNLSPVLSAGVNKLRE